jgi:hypothetical protein
MAIALAGSAATSNAVADPRTLSFTVNAAANLLVAVLQNVNTTTVVSVSYGGTAMTLLSGGQASNNLGVYIAYLYNPTTGVAQNISFDLTGSSSARIVAAAFSGADTSYTPAAAVVQGEGTAVTSTLDVTPDRDSGLIIFSAVMTDATPTFSFGTGQTSLSQLDDGSHGKATTYEITSGTSLNTQTWTTDASSPWFASATFFAAREPAGYGVAGTVGAGASASVFAETGTGVVGTKGSGVQEFSGGAIATKAGFGAVGTVGSGTSQRISGGAVNTKAGFAVVGLTAASRSASFPQPQGVSIGFGQSLLTAYPDWTRIDA